ncbi:MAG TPA: rhodanese-like domain-containing protein [Flavobacterium sp.]|nr:rhodanese-like domain-containing protein [Flavobacterium sp.]
MTCIFSAVAGSMQAQDMIFERIFDETLAQGSYVIANDQKDAIVVDPKRDIDTYLDFAKKHQLTIKYVTETHIHADYLSGSRELAHATNAKLLLSAEGGNDWRYDFPHEELKNGQVISLGNISLKVMHTPGHTPESITFLVSNTKQSNDPIKAITGDFIFVGDVGRPDLLEKVAGQKGSQFTGAHQLFESLNEFSKLPPTIEIWPGHGAGSFCGKSLSSIPQSTLTQEMQTSKAFQLLKDKEAFTKYILEGQPEPPKYFAVMKQWNKQIRPLLIEVPKIPLLNPSEVVQAQKNNVLVIDTRKKEEVAKGFIPGSLHIEGGKSFSTFVGSLVDYTEQIILIANGDAADDLTRKLMRIGMDNIYGYIDNVESFNNLKMSKKLSIDEFKNQIKNPEVQLIDVRTSAEFKAGHIKGFQNIPLNTLVENKSKINNDIPVIIHCQSGVRAAIAYSILEKMGLTNILNYGGGINDWIAKNNELEK